MARYRRRFGAPKRRYGVTGELKWRHFAPSDSTFAHLTVAQKDALREEVYGLLNARNAVRIIAVVTPACSHARNGFYRDEVDGLFQHAIKALELWFVSGK